MSKNLSDAFITQFFSEVKHAYQARGKLRPTVRTRTDVVGSTAEFQKMGKGLGRKRTPQSEVTPMNVSHSKPSLTLEDWEFPEYTDIFDDQKTNIDERQELAFTIGSAMGRREDQIILDAIDAGSFSGNQLVEETVGNTDGFSTEKIRNAAFHFDDLEIPEGDRHIVATATAKRQLLGTTAPTSADFAQVRSLVNGDIDTWMGFQFHWIGTNRDEGGLTIDGSSIASNYAYHRSSMGYAIGIDMRMDVDYIPTRTSWLSNGSYSAGATIVDSEGIVEIQSDETVSVTQGTDA